jgi:hypothetical protein
MAVNKVVFGSVSIIDISDSTIVKDRIMKGDRGYGADGEPIEGEFTLDSEMTEQDNLITQIQSALQNKVSQPSGTLETWTFTLEDGSTVTKEVYVE